MESSSCQNHATEQMLCAFSRSGILIALAGTIGSVLVSRSCAACQAAASAIGMHFLAGAGVCFYSTVALLMARRRRAPVARAAVLTAAGVHLALLACLYHERAICVSCLTAAAGAFISAFAVIASNNFRWKIEPWFFASGFLIALIVVVAQLRFHGRSNSESLKELQAVVLAETNALPAGKVLLFAFTRDNCRYCRQFEDERLPQLKEKFGSELVVQRCAAPENVPTPSFVIVGARNETMVGLPPASVLEEAIDEALLKARDN